MKVTIERSALLRALQHVQSVVERKNTIPILSNLLMAAEEGSLRLTATDMDMAAVDLAPCDTARTGRVTAPALLLYEIVRKLPEGAQLELESDSDAEKLALRGGNASFSLNCLPVDDFPAMAEDDLPIVFDIAGAQLRRLIEKTRFAISTEETRYYLNGIYLHAVTAPERSALRSVATDGHRLARVETALPEGAEALAGAIVPRKAVNELYKLLDDFDGEAGVSASETNIRFSVGDTVLTTKLVDGTFPDYERVIPQDNKNVVKVHSRGFAAAVDRVSTISTETPRSVKLGIGGDSMVLSARSMDQSSANEKLEIEHDGDAVDIGFNARYVLDMTQQVDGDSLRLAISDAASPAVVSDCDDATALYVLMPMRV